MAAISGAADIMATTDVFSTTFIPITTPSSQDTPIAKAHLGSGDITIVLVYIIVTFVIGIWVIIKRCML